MTLTLSVWDYIHCTADRQRDRGIKGGDRRGADVVIFGSRS